MIRFGALAMTRAMCPPGSLSDRYVRDVGRTTRYTLGQHELRLELPANQGVLIFRAAPP
jgi:para-nitrobenzyl esterase